MNCSKAGVWASCASVLMSAVVMDFLAASAAFGQTQEELSTITVTAQRRAESLADVPISVTALSSDDLTQARITSTADLNLLAPGLTVSEGGVYVEPAIRGITTDQDSPLAQSNVATYIDGVYQQSTVGAIYQLPDIKEIQVLEGPQGTLFGRNATGGAILINTLDPSLTAFGGNALVRYGNYGQVAGQAFVGGPIIQDRLAASLSLYDDHMGGYQHNIAGPAFDDNVDSLVVRGKIRFVPWEGADFILTGMYTDLRDYDTLKQSSLFGNNLGLALGLPPSQVASQPWQYSDNVNSFNKTQERAISLRGNIDLGPGTLTTTSSYNTNPSINLSDGDNTALSLAKYGVYAYTRSYSQEVLYATNQLGDFHAVGGLFYYYAKGGYNPLNVNDYAETIFTAENQQSYAAFVDGTYNITQQFSVTGGLRYTYESQSSYAGIVFGTPTPPPTYPFLGSASWNKVTPRASLQYKATDATNLYFTYSQGFKSGAFNATSFQTAPANPETVNAYEIGVKSSAISQVTVNAAAFYYDYTDLQVTSISQTNQAVTQKLANAASARIFGAELNTAWKATDQFSLEFGGGYLHARYSSFPDASINVPTGAGGNMTEVANISGATLIRAPEWSGHLTARYVQPTDVGPLDLSVTAFFSSHEFFDPSDRIVQPDYHILNGNLGWSPRGYDNLTFRLWGKNLTNAKVIYTTVIGELADSVGYQMPRTYGVEAAYKF
jgi:iron complex outermembrane receptor protein